MLLKLVVLQRVVPNYRLALFQRLAEDPDLDFTLLMGEDLPNSKVKSAKDLNVPFIRKLRTKFLKLKGRVLPWHVGLLSELKTLRPDVILCEGESHFLGYLTAIFYKTFINRKVKLLHWCFITLPGEKFPHKGPRAWIKGFFRRFFDGFVLYSSFGKPALKHYGVSDDRIFIATNVGDTAMHMQRANALTLTGSEAREKLGLADCFTALYVGTLDPNKRPEVLLALAESMDSRDFQFIVLGDGPMRETLQAQASTLPNAYVPGRVIEELPLYYKAADVLLIPGRGGIIISEAMAFRLPVVVRQADGTEQDLIESGVSGVVLSDDSIESYRSILQDLKAHPTKKEQWAENGYKRLSEQFTTEKMADQIRKAAFFVANQS